jgi:glutathione synthase/RimK-type ligase-like ATP-grasp enzyme
VTLPIKIAGKRFRVHFTLADRSRSNFPILLGKRFLNKKFLVDVSQNHLLDDHKKLSGTQKILVLCSVVDQAKHTFFAKVGQAASSRLEVHDYDDLLFRFGDKPIVELQTKEGLVDVADFDLVYFKSHKGHLEAAMAVGRYLHYRNVNFIDREFSQLVSRSKLSEMMQLQTFGLPVPPGVVASNRVLLKQAQAISQELGWPLIVKDVFSDKGKNNYLVQDMVELTKILKQANGDQLFVIQKYIANNGYCRVLVLGKEAKLVIRRVALKADQQNADAQKRHLNNVRGGVNASLQPVESADATMISLSQKAADVMRRQVAGVDILQEKSTDKATGKWYILEVNSSPQLLTKKFSDEKATAMGQYLKREAERWYL